ncbi:putative G-protein coupled receptor 52 [Papilio xuthus]|uniref:Putative G-protein coupled receptor 52 n=1 Tax=Papilio xuthus TaxID=66420 RepID=A0A194Q706_PAPXU|nr:putative G-protein coupled receptor 52 [Papilio xuthus]
MPARLGGAGAGSAAADVSVADSPLASLESLTQAAVIAVVGIAIVISNLLIIAAFLNFKGLAHEVINYYLLSLAVADLLCGLLVVPLSVHAAAVGRWVFGGLVCRLTGYIEVTLWSVSVYTFMWISVDRYLAVRKPLRYETVSLTVAIFFILLYLEYGPPRLLDRRSCLLLTSLHEVVFLSFEPDAGLTHALRQVQTRTRSQCWMVFTWISAAMLCCPPLLGYKKEANYDARTFICMLDWASTYAYTATLGILVLGPSLISIVYNYYYIFAMRRKLNSGAPMHDKEYATALAENLANPSHCMSFLLVAAFWLSWIPYFALQIYEYFTAPVVKVPMLHFGVVWLGILNSFWKIVILITFSPQFRLAPLDPVPYVLPRQEPPTGGAHRHG